MFPAIFPTCKLLWTYTVVHYNRFLREYSSQKGRERPTSRDVDETEKKYGRTEIRRYGGNTRNEERRRGITTQNK
jgi:hypothetical protein